MIGVKKIKKSEVFDQFLANKFWFIGSVLFFLVAAFVYINNSSPKFEVTSKIEVAKSSGLNTDSLKSIALLQNVLGSLPFQVDYYTKGPESMVQLHRDSLPIKVLVEKNAVLVHGTRLELTVVSPQQFEIAQEDTITSYRFNELVKQPFGQFRVVKGPLFSVGGAPVTLQLKDKPELLEEYESNFNTKTNDDNTVTLKVVADRPQKGIDFLNKLLEVYSAGHTAVTYSKPAAVIPPVNNDQAIKIQAQISALKAKAGKLDGDISSTATDKLVTVTHKTKKSISDPQFKTLLAIKSYVKSPVDQFVQVPYADDIKDDDLRDLVKTFNKTELDKQRFLTDSAANNSKIVSSNRQLAQLKRDITENIDIQTTEEDDRDPMEAYKHPAADPSSKTITVTTTTTTTVNANKEKNTEYKDSLSVTNKQLKAKMQEYTMLEKNKPAIVAPAPVTRIVGNAIKIIEKPGDNIKAVYPGPVVPYLLAILIGLAVAVLLVYVKNLIMSYSWTNPIDFKKLNEKLTSLISRRQID